MSEYGHFFRVHGLTEETFLELLQNIPDYTIAPFSLDPSMRTISLEGSGGEEDGRNTFHLIEDERGHTKMAFFNFELDEILVEVLCEAKKTFVKYGYHTGAGYDELVIYVDGERRLTEDTAEGYFQCDDTATTIEDDWDYEPSMDPDDPMQGCSNKLLPVEGRLAAIENLANEMGESAVIIDGWRYLAANDWPLSYLEGLDW